MFLRADETVDVSAQAVMLCMDSPDLSGLREQLFASGVKVPPIGHPEYIPGGEICVADPDGYVIRIVHWEKTEHPAWEKRIGGKTLGASP
jgi:hypothetical protein